LWPIETAAQERTKSDNEGISPERQLWDKLKANHPDALQLLRTKDGYRLYNEDAVQGAKILGIALKEYPERDITASAGIPYRRICSIAYSAYFLADCWFLLLFLSPFF